MRLKAENALAGDDERRRVALGTILGQIDRLDRLVSELLTMTQRREIAPRDVELSAFLNPTESQNGQVGGLFLLGATRV